MRSLAAVVLLASCAAPPVPSAAPARAPRAPASASRPEPRPTASSAPVAEAPRPPEPAALTAPPEPAPGTLVDLEIPGHHPAVVVVPEAGRRPVLVATHGAGGTPEVHCAYWRDVLGEVAGRSAAPAFILCPRGVTMDVYAPPEERGYFYPNHPALEREVRAALAALEARFGPRVDIDRAVYAGFSQGATMGALAFARAPLPFGAAVLVEGGSDDWSLHTARTFEAGGGERVLFVCGRASCVEGARRSAAYLRKAGAAARVVDRSGAGHTHDGGVREGVVAALPWLLEGDGRFGGK